MTYVTDIKNLPLSVEEMCEYDEIGNPTLYRGKAATWEKGRQLKSYNGVEFNYDGSGRRVSKKRNYVYV